MTIHSLAKNLVKSVPCPRCGIPRIISLIADWTPSGLIEHHLLGVEQPPSIIIEVEEYRSMLSSLSEILGINIERVITQSERKAIKVWSWEMLKKFPSFFRKSKIGSRMFIEIYMLVVSLAGLGEQETGQVAPGSHVLFYGKNLFHLPSAVGDRQGFCELLYGTPYSARGMYLSDEESVIACYRSREEAELEERLELPPREVIRGDVEFERCPSCGVPRALSDYRWEWDDGRVINTANGLREMMIQSWTVDVLCQELTRELGEEIPQLIIEAERDFTIKRLEEFGLRLTHSRDPRRGADAWENIRVLLDNLPFRGMGNPVGLSLEEDTLKLRVNNPFTNALICGKVLGYYETFVGVKGKLECDVPPGEWAIDITVTPA